MSVKIAFARQLISTVVHRDDKAWAELLPGSVNQSGYYEVMFTGYKGTYRTRLKRFPAIQDGFAYLNKLSTGGWMDDDEYDAAWQLLLKLADVCKVDVFR